MSWIDVIPEADAEGRLEEVYEAISGDRGKVSNIMRIHSLLPKSMEAHMELYMSVMFERADLSRAEREMIATAVSAANDCEYCKNHHAVALDAYWNDRARVERFMTNWRDLDLEDRHVAMLEYAEKLTEAPSSVSETDVDRLRAAGFDEDDVLLINLTASYFNFVNRIAEGLGVEFTEEEMQGYEY